MKKYDTPLEDLYVIEPNIIKDSRGFFYESFNKQKFDELLNLDPLDSDFIQDNHSKSAFGTIRGLHFQTKPYGQSKLVRCVSGAILDVAVDIRPRSKTFGKYFSVILNSDNNYQLWIPYGFAHGFQVLSEIAEVNYKVDEYWQPKFEGSIRYDDPDININWKKIPVQISDKDKSAKFLKEIKDF